MSDRDTLLSTLPEALHDDASKLYEASAEPDPHEVIAELHRRGQLGPEQVRSAVLELEGSLRVGRLRSKPPEDRSPSILGPLGAGAMGEVLLAKDEALNRVVAVKRLLPELAARPAIAERFYREAQITAQLDHPSIVPIHGLYPEPNGSLSYTMKLVRGRTVEDYLDEARAEWTKTGGERGENMLTSRLERFLHVCDALAYAHDRGVVHRDLKPENVMVGSFGQVQVMDWGIAKVLAQPKDPDSASTGLHSNKMHQNNVQTGTRVGSVFGTPRYMSPEQAQGQNDKVDARSDQYALGLILFELVTLKPAVSATLDVNGCIEWAKSGRKQAMTHFHRKGPVPRELVAIVNKATELKPERRYASVAAFAEDIRRYLRDEEVLAKRDSMLQRLQRWVGRHRSTVVALGMLSVMLFVVTLSMLGLSALGAIEWRRRVAAAHEDTVTALLAQAQSGAGEVDTVFRTAEKSLVGLTYGVEAALERPNLSLEEDEEQKYDPCEPAPIPKARPSEIYGRKVALDRVAFRHMDCETQRDRVMRIASSPYAFLQALLDSAGDVAKLNRKEQNDRVLKDGVPIRWARFVTPDGMMAFIPGTENKLDAPASTTLPWYNLTNDTAIRWSGPAMDPDGTGLVLTATRTLFGRQRGKELQLGVVAVDLTTAAVTDKLAPPQWIEEVWLVNPEGKAVLWNGLPTTGPYEPRAVPEELASFLLAQSSGWYEGGGRVAAWATVDAVGWRYVLWTNDDVWSHLRRSSR